MRRDTFLKSLAALAAAGAARDFRKVSRRMGGISLGMLEAGTAPSCPWRLSFGCPAYWGNY